MVEKQNKLFEEEEEELDDLEEIEETETEVKPVKIRKGIITISKGTYSESVDLKGGMDYISVSFDGHLEGSSCPCDSEEQAQEQIKCLLEKHKDNYKIKINDERIKEELFISSTNTI